MHLARRFRVISPISFACVGAASKDSTNLDFFVVKSFVDCKCFPPYVDSHTQQ
jgi:hypothetical protein